MTLDLAELLRSTSARHSHLCPRQVLGVRLGLAGLAAVGLRAPITKLDGLIVVETDGCFVDGIEVSTGGTPGHRTLRLNDLGKLAATFVSLQSGRAIRLATRPDSRIRALAYAPAARNRYSAQLEGYQAMPDAELFRFQEVRLVPDAGSLLSQEGLKATCVSCGEEIINQREVTAQGLTLCRSCAGDGYYQLVPQAAGLPSLKRHEINDPGEGFNGLGAITSLQTPA